MYQILMNYDSRNMTYVLVFCNKCKKNLFYEINISLFIYCRIIHKIILNCTKLLSIMNIYSYSTLFVTLMINLSLTF